MRTLRWKCIRHEIVTKVTGAVLVAALLAAFVGPYVPVHAQPVSVPTLSGSYSYESGALDPYFNYAGASRSQADWEYIIKQGKFVLAAGWEASIDAEIEAYVGAVGQSDHFNTVAEYRDYLRGELQLQKQSQFAVWEAAANLEIDQQRVAFLTDLSEEKERAAAEESEDSVAAGRAEANREDTTAQDIEREYQAWEQDFQATFSDGMYQFQTALAQLQGQYDAANGALAEREAEFAAIQAQIDAYENTVRAGIRTATDFMQNYLDTSGVFYQWNCDGQNNCSIDYGSPTAAATDMQAIIDQLNDGLDQDQPLSVLASTMYTALDQRRTYAQQQYQNWVNQSTGTNSYSTNMSTDAALNTYLAAAYQAYDDATPNYLQLSFDDWRKTADPYEMAGVHDAEAPNKGLAAPRDVLGITPAGINAATNAVIAVLKQTGTVNAVVRFLAGQSAPELNAIADSFQASLGNPQHDITGILSADIIGVGSLVQTYGPYYGIGGCSPQAPIDDYCRNTGVREEHGHAHYASMGDLAFIVDHTYAYYTWSCGGEDCLNEHESEGEITYNVLERLLTITFSYQWEDANARHNADIWQGYVNDLDPVVSHWLDDILPAIQTWETQVAVFEADYAAWQAEAAHQQAAAQVTYDKAVSEIIQQRSKWYAGMQDEYRDGRTQWQAVVQGKAEAPAPASLSGKNAAALEIAAAAGGSFGQELEKTVDLLNRESDVPDFSLLSGVAKSFENAGRGIAQLGLQSELNNRVIEERRQNSERIIDLLSQNQSRVEGDDYISIDGFQAEIGADGMINAARSIYSGKARQIAGTGGLSRQDYEAEYADQSLNIAPPPPAKLVDTGSIFDFWDTDEVLAEHEKNREENQALLDAKFEGVLQQLEAANQTAVDNYHAYQKDVGDKIAAKKRKKKFGSLLQSLATAMFSGGISFQEAVAQEVQNQAAAHVAEVTGFPAGIFTSIMGGMTAQEAVKDYIKTETDNVITQGIVKATGLPAGFISGMVSGGKVDFGGDSMKAAFQSYTDELMAEKMEEATGIPGLAGFLKRTTIADKNKKLAAKEAAQPKPEDFATGGATYVWRNADHNPELAMAVQAGETVAGAAAVGTGWGTAAFAGYMAAKQGYKGYLKGDSSEDILKAAAASGVSSVINHYTSKAGVSVNLSYDSDTGFGGSISGSIPIAGAPVPGLSLGGSLNFQEGQGYTGASVNAGLQSDDGYGLNASMNFGADGGYTGGSLSASYNTDSGFGGSMSANFSPDGNNSISAQLTYKTKVDRYRDGKQVEGASATHTAGLGLTLNSDGSKSAQFINSVGEEDKYGIGLNSYSAGNTLTVNVDANGQYSGHSNDISLDFDFQTQSEKEQAMADRLAFLEDKFLNRPEEATQEELEEFYRLRDRNSKENRAIAQDRYIDRMVHQGKLTPEQAELLREDPSLWHTATYAKNLLASGDSGESRETTWDKFTGAIGDAVKWIGGTYSTADGMLDTQNGEFVYNTCFVAGTLVRTAPNAEGAFQLDGKWYKKIEDVSVGDRVLSWDEQTQRVSYKTVTETFVHRTNLIYTVAYDDGGPVIETTFNHPFYIAGRGWTEVRELQAGQLSYSASSAVDGSMLASATGSSAAEIASVSREWRDDVVYNIEVEDTHTYFVSDVDVLVHNYPQEDRGNPITLTIRKTDHVLRTRAEAERRRRLREKEGIFLVEKDGQLYETIVGPDGEPLKGPDGQVLLLPPNSNLLHLYSPDRLLPPMDLVLNQEENWRIAPLYSKTVWNGIEVDGLAGMNGDINPNWAGGLTGGVRYYVNSEGQTEIEQFGGIGASRGPFGGRVDYAYNVTTGNHEFEGGPTGSFYGLGAGLLGGVGSEGTITGWTLDLFGLADRTEKTIRADYSTASRVKHEVEWRTSIGGILNRVANGPPLSGVRYLHKEESTTHYLDFGAIDYDRTDNVKRVDSHTITMDCYGCATTADDLERKYRQEAQEAARIQAAREQRERQVAADKAYARQQMAQNPPASYGERLRREAEILRQRNEARAIAEARRRHEAQVARERELVRQKQREEYIKKNEDLAKWKKLPPQPREERLRQEADELRRRAKARGDYED